MVGDLPYPHPTNAAVSAVMRANRKTGSKPEVRVRQMLHRLGYRFRKNLPIALAGITAYPDIVFSRRRLVVFIDGCFWHACPEHGNVPRANTLYWGPKLQRNIERDRRVDQSLADAGWRVLRIWEHLAPDEAVRRVVSALQLAEVGGAR